MRNAEEVDVNPKTLTGAVMLQGFLWRMAYNGLPRSSRTVPLVRRDDRIVMYTQRHQCDVTFSSCSSSRLRCHVICGDSEYTRSTTDRPNQRRREEWTRPRFISAPAVPVRRRVASVERRCAQQRRRRQRLNQRRPTDSRDIDTLSRVAQTHTHRLDR